MIVSGISRPELYVFTPTTARRNGAAIIIFPGGGYWVNALSHEGTDVARECAKWGLTAFVVKYRIPDSATMINPSLSPFQDAQQAMLRVRSEAKKYGIDPARIGIMGFSAGGHLAATLATRFDEPLLPGASATSLRPAFAALIYPVISADSSIAHHGSFDKLLGKSASPATLDSFSHEKNVNENTPPVFLIHANDDDVVPVQNSLRFYEAMLQHKRPVELHLYPSGGHGFGMNNPRATGKWMNELRTWLTDIKMISHHAK